VATGQARTPAVPEERVRSNEGVTKGCQYVDFDFPGSRLSKWKMKNIQ